MTKRRKLAGLIVEDECARMSLTQERAARQMQMSPSRLDHIREGDIKMTERTLRSVEGVLDMPDCLLTYIIEGDLEAIAKIGETEMRPDLRRRIVSGLARIDDDTQWRRSL